jgi:Holliday junction resolvase
VSGYSEGRKLEYAAAAILWADGYWVIRAAGSKGSADIVALKRGEALFVQCKRSGTMGPGERNSLIGLARQLDGVPVCALWAKEGRAARTVEFRQLTGPGPRDWQPWTANHALEGSCG